MSKIILDTKPEPKAGSTDEQAAVKAELSARAADAINMAGRGLFAAVDSCNNNAPDGKTLAILVIAQGYVNDALYALIQRENSGILDPGQVG